MPRAQEPDRRTVAPPNDAAVSIRIIREGNGVPAGRVGEIDDRALVVEVSLVVGPPERTRNASGRLASLLIVEVDPTLLPSHPENRQLRPIRRPFGLRCPDLEIGHNRRFAACGADHRDLAVLAGLAGSPQEGEALAVRGPARSTVHRAVSEHSCFGAIPQPDRTVVAVIFEIHPGHHERDPDAVRMDLRIGH